jgi:RHS repeat-associated protein
LQSVLGQSSHSGGILAAQSYSAFGKIKQTVWSNNELKYTGRERDGATGFYYYRARYYDPVTGRFISEDPKGFDAGINFYAYVGNNPVNANDPTGNAPSIENLMAGIASKFAILECVPCAKALVNAAIGNSESVVIHSVQANGNQFLWSEIAQKSISNNGYHVGVEIDGLIYDNISSKGISVENWYSQFDARYGVTFNDPKPFDSNSSVRNLFGVGITFDSVKEFAKETVTDPVTYYWPLFSGGIATQDQEMADMNSTAQGGFVLYPDKSNTNQMRSVYKK